MLLGCGRKRAYLRLAFRSTWASTLAVQIVSPLDWTANGRMDEAVCITSGSLTVGALQRTRMA